MVCSVSNIFQSMSSMAVMGVGIDNRRCLCWGKGRKLFSPLTLQMMYLRSREGKIFPRLHSKLWTDIKSERKSLSPRSEHFPPGHLPSPPPDGLQRPPHTWDLLPIPQEDQSFKHPFAFSLQIFDQSVCSRESAKRVHILWFHLYKVQNQTKLISAVTSQDTGYPWGRWWLAGEQEEFSVAGHVLSLDPGSGYTGVFSWWKCIRLYTDDMYILIYVSNTSITKFKRYVINKYLSLLDGRKYIGTVPKNF